MSPKTDSAIGGNVPAAPAPSAWFIRSVVPSLTQRMLNELPPSQTMVTKD